MKPGYKQTEVGVIPEEWGVGTIGQQCQIFGRIGFRGYTVDDIVDEGTGAIAINPSNIQDGKTVFDECTYVSWHKYEESPEIKIDEGDVILVKTGSTFGKTAMVKNLPGKATLNPQVIVFKKLKLWPGFFGYMMGFPTVQNQITAGVVGGALPTLSQKLVAAFKMPLPPTLSEQRAIAEALGDVDGLLGGLDRLIAKKRDLKQAAMQQLLTGQTRLPGFSGEWPVKELRSLYAKVFNKSPLSSADGHTLGDYPLFVSGGVAKRIDRALFKNTEALIISDGGVFDVKYFSGDFSVTDHCFVISLIGDMRFYFQWMSLRKAELDLMAFKGSGLRNLDKPTFGKLGVPLPQPAEQTAIAEVLADMDAELAALEQRREKTRLLKQAMMQELLTGKTRLVPAEAAHA